MRTTTQPLTRVMALHALLYCERLFYLEEVEEIYVADANVYAGRRLHEELADDEEIESYHLENEELGLNGKMDAIRKRDGEIYPYEHKRGRSNKGDAWLSDRVQVVAYAMLLEKHLNQTIHHARIRYHRDNKTVKININDNLKQEVMNALKRAHELRESSDRPPITDKEYLCITCSLSPVCLPEENRKAKQSDFEAIRLYPPLKEKQTIHILGHGDKISRQNETLKWISKNKDEIVLPIEDIEEIVIHGYSQITTQAIGLCAYHDVPVHWFTSGGNFLCSLSTGIGKVQRRMGQFKYLSDPLCCLDLAKRTVMNRIENQIQLLMRLSRGKTSKRELIQKHILQMRRLQTRGMDSESVDILRGFEGACANTYFSALRLILENQIPDEFMFKKRTRRPPKDRFNSIMSFGYGLLYKSVMSAILTVGLEPALGYYHTPRSAAHPLVLDLMELFRVPVWDQAFIASLRRNRWDANLDFVFTKNKVWLSDNGRKKAIEVFENRLDHMWKHPILNYSISYGRHLELEVRLLEKCWTEGKSLFATSKIR